MTEGICGCNPTILYFVYGDYEAKVNTDGGVPNKMPVYFYLPGKSYFYCPTLSLATVSVKQ
jgi:hypothetical protein